MSLPVICIITQASCGHCIQMRGGSGELLPDNEATKSIPGGFGWTSSFFKNLILGSKLEPQFIVYNLHYNTYVGIEEDIYEKMSTLTEFIWDGEEIVRKVYSNVNYPSEFESFCSFAKTKVPGSLLTYIKYYPLWLFCKGKSWNDGITKKIPILAFAYNSETIKINDDSNKNPIYSVTINNVDMIRNIFSYRDDFLEDKFKVNENHEPTFGVKPKHLKY